MAEIKPVDCKKCDGEGKIKKGKTCGRCGGSGKYTPKPAPAPEGGE